ncbi:histidine phosphatase family protein [Psychrobacillus glaciei]|uniref:Histidine phosphatase family protein n=1 Tax=Psychrobacillus glaciei TaxID=2283160 RepID=A0A5J6SSX7_9BACI|nr:histidine phosphatase family protein [Psychrobacillus glaciei]QFG00005.1 histidine phosphatase family protein [Psychrobacillus glaciei]
MIYVVRHGQTDLNKEGRMQGRLGLPLNVYGIEQAELLRDELQNIKFDYVFSSPQERAIQTAKLVTGIKVIIDTRLDVFDLGEADRLKKAEVKMDGVVPDSSVYKSVEDIHSYIKRVFLFMKELEADYGKRQLNILISGHKCTTGCIGAYFEGIPKDKNILRFSSNNGKYKVYNLGKNEVRRWSNGTKNT